MIIQITSRHVEVTDAVRGYVENRLSPVLNVYPMVEHAHVIMDVEKFRHIAEVVVQGKQHLHAEARAETDDMYKSIDAVTDKIDRQLRKARDKKVDHKTGAHRERLADVEGAGEL
ncbi:MAG: ribosome hibernation-promoting factor, HPF/YfiA family [Kiritimatiellia bacterium]|nr:ribosome-associated translation inhibitor RaiA [Lentisphaerota bacterium]